MRTPNSSRVAWSVAVAALALWATSAPVTFGQVGQVAAGAARLFEQAQVETTTTVEIDTQVNQDAMAMPADATVDPNAPCVPVPPAIPQPIPPVAAPTQNEGTFHICNADAATEQAIAQLIAGRSFSATLRAVGDGCADLSIRATSAVPNGSSTTNLSVSLGSGRNLTIRIQSDQGTTHATIGAGN